MLDLEDWKIGEGDWEYKNIKGYGDRVKVEF
jgi:hypothetical protein